MSKLHDLYKYSITCKTDDLAVLHCLRSLCQYSEQTSCAQIGWGGTGEKEWRNNRNVVSFRFTSPKYRDFFVKEATRILKDLWEPLRTNDNDPATSQRSKPKTPGQ